MKTSTSQRYARGGAGSRSRIRHRSCMASARHHTPGARRVPPRAATMRRTRAPPAATDFRRSRSPMMKVGFDNERYLAEQSAAIRTRIEECGDKLYLEFGGKLMFDFHAARVLPGFDPNVKLRLLQMLGDEVEVARLHLRRRHRAAQGAGRFRHRLRLRRAEAHRRPAPLEHRGVGRRDHPLRRAAGRARVQEQARAAGLPRLHARLHHRLPDRRRHHRQRPRVRREHVHPDHQARSWW